MRSLTHSTVTMAAGRCRRARSLRWLALGALALLTAGCTAEGPSPTASSQGFGPAVAFDSVDGPPPQVFQRLVKVLETEGATRHISVGSRDANPTYRVRSYYAAQVKRGTHNASIAWVWDVYTGAQSRAIRLSGTEPAGMAGPAVAALPASEAPETGAASQALAVSGR